MIVAVITARGGSKGLPKKNVLTLNGKPLIAWTIESALKSKYVSRVFVTTDDSEIASISREFGAEVISRPKELARDESTSDDAIAHAIDALAESGVDFTDVVLLQPTSPLRTSEHIDQGIEKYIKENASIVISGFEPTLCISKVYKLTESGHLNPIVDKDSSFKRRQDADSYFYPNGAIYIFSVERFNSQRLIPRDNITPFFMLENDSVDIDTKQDLEKCEAIMSNKTLNQAGKNVNNPTFEICGRKIGLDYEPLVIAEIGINHGGSLAVAKQIVDSAIEGGAEVIKHQTHVVEDEMSDEAKTVIPGNADVSIYEIMKSSALNEEEETELKHYVESKGAIFISTPFSRAAVYRLERMGVEAYKIGSGECNNYPLLELVASLKKPVILSTGMNGIPAIKKAVNIFRKYDTPYSLLHTTNLYPTPDHLIRLGAMQELANVFPDAVVGLSDHSIGNLACLGAVACGASILERHYTDSKDRQGPDIICSMDAPECAELISFSKRMAKMRGGEKGAIKEEQVTIDFAYASVVSEKEIKKGEKFTRENIWVKRPGTGDFLAEDYELLIGKVAATDIYQGIQIKKEMVK